MIPDVGAQLPTWLVVWMPIALFAAFCLGADYGVSFERRRRGQND